MNNISVIIPVFNRQELIKRAIDSVLNQTLNPGEIIVVDDGSTDNTASIIKQNYPEVKLITISHSGVSITRNTGIKQSKYKYVALLDSDDEWDKTKLEKQYGFIKANPELLISHTGEKWIRNGKSVNRPKKYKKFGGNVFEKCLPLTMIGASTVMFDKRVFDKYGYFDESLPVCEDYDLWLRISSHEPVGFIDEELTVKYGGHSGQLSMSEYYLDEWRFYSLEKFISKKLYADELQKRGAVEQLLKFYEIIVNGLEKKNKTSELENYKFRLKKFSNYLI